MYKANYHTHTFRCQHAGGTEEDYVQAAIANNLQVLGISDHGPFETLNLGLRMSYEELCDYVQTIDQLKEIYRDKITLYKGVEIEYIPTMCNYYEKLLTKHGLEYLVIFFPTEIFKIYILLLPVIAISDMPMQLPKLSEPASFASLRTRIYVCSIHMPGIVTAKKHLILFWTPYPAVIFC